MALCSLQMVMIIELSACFVPYSQMYGVLCQFDREVIVLPCHSYLSEAAWVLYVRESEWGNGVDVGIHFPALKAKEVHCPYHRFSLRNRFHWRKQPHHQDTRQCQVVAFLRRSLVAISVRWAPHRWRWPPSWGRLSHICVTCKQF